MDAILVSASAEVQRNGGDMDEKTRKMTINSLRQLQYELETPEETMLRLIYSASIRTLTIPLS
jgi:demethylsterigmatocystin 6-O-methyltransferase